MRRSDSSSSVEKRDLISRLLLVVLRDCHRHTTAAEFRGGISFIYLIILNWLSTWELKLRYGSRYLLKYFPSHLAMVGPDRLLAQPDKQMRRIV